MATPAALYTLTAPALAAFQAALAAPQATQTQLLHTILQHNAHSQFGRRHGFAKLSGYADFAAAVPLGNYASHQHAIEQELHLPVSLRCIGSAGDVFTVMVLVQPDPATHAGNGSHRYRVGCGVVTCQPSGFTAARNHRGVGQDLAF